MISKTRADRVPTSVMRPTRPSPLTTALPLRTPVAAAGIDNQAAHIDTAGIADDPRGDVAAPGPRLSVKQEAQRFIFVFELLNVGQLLFQLADLALQFGVLLEELFAPFEGAKPIGDAVDRPHDGFEDRRQRIRGARAQALGVGRLDLVGD